MAHPPPAVPDQDSEDSELDDEPDDADGSADAEARETGNGDAGQDYDLEDEEGEPSPEEDDYEDEPSAAEEGDYEDEPSDEDHDEEFEEETGDRPAAPGPPPAAGAPARPVPPPPRPRPVTLPPRTVPATAAGARTGAAAPPRGESPSESVILPPYERSRPGGDPWYRRVFSSPARAAVVIGLAVLVLAGATFAGLQMAGEDEPATQAGGTQSSGGGGNADGGGGGGDGAAAINPGDVTVAVLNGTTVTGLAADIGDRVESQGFQLGTVTNSLDQQRAESVVFYAPGAEREAEDVARRLKIAQREQIDPETQALAGDASVVVVVGADKT
jgi:hypothetical protein